MFPIVPFSRPRRRTPTRWFVAAGAAALVSASALTACGPRDEPPLAGDVARVGTPVPTQVPATQVPAAAAAPAAAMAPPPVTVAQAPPAQPGGYAAPPAPTPVPPATADDRADLRTAPAPERNARVVSAAPSGRLGSIERIEPIRQRPQGTGTGAVLGGVAGAVIGNQFGHGLGRAAMTGVGAAGGAVAGNNIERNVRKQVVGYRVHVRLDNGRTRTFQRSQVGNLHVGDRVRVDGNGFRRA